MALQDNVSLIALLVSLIALLIASGQLLQQIFGTAEGYRRCQASIIGLWSTTRRRRYKLSELRIETTFNTPEFFMLDLVKEDLEQHRGEEIHIRRRDQAPARLRSGESCAITGLPTSQIRTMATMKNSIFLFKQLQRRHLEAAHYVGWLILLQQLHRHERRYDSLIIPPIWRETRIMPSKTVALMSRSRPAVRSWPRSWDLIPPDVVKPLASSTLRNIMILSIRLRMSWNELRPAEGILQAEGCGHSLTSERFRGLGLVLRYDFNDYATNGDENNLDQPLLIPTEAADRFAFGIIPGCNELGTNDVELGGGHHGDLEYISRALKRLKVNKESCELFAGSEGRISHKQDLKRLLVGIYDIQYINTPVLPLPSLGATNFIPPLDRSSSCFGWREGRMVWRTWLRDLQETQTELSQTMRIVIDRLEELHAMDADAFDSTHAQSFYFAYDSVNEKALIRLAWLRTVHNETTTHFHHLEDKWIATIGNFSDDLFGRGSLYPALMSAHLEMAIHAGQKVRAMTQKKLRKCAAIRGHQERWMTELAYRYAEGVSRVVGIVIRILKLDSPRLSSEKQTFSDDIRDAWWMMTLRAIVWSMSVNPIYPPPAGFPLPSRFYHSEQHVYIT